jgi:lipocalin
MECFAKKANTDNFQPLNYQNLKIAQEKDKTIQKNPKNAKHYMFSRTSMGEEKLPN